MTTPTAGKNEIRVTKVKSLTSYLTYIYHLFTDENKFEFITINAIGNAIAKAVSLAELCRLRIPALYTTIEINFVELPNGDTKKRVTGVKITLSKKQLDKTHTGYMDPLPLDKVQEYKVMPKVEGEERTERRSRRGTRRGGRYPRREDDDSGDYRRRRDDDSGEYRRRRGARRTRRGGFRDKDRE